MKAASHITWTRYMDVVLQACLLSVECCVVAHVSMLVSPPLGHTAHRQGLPRRRASQPGWTREVHC